jgi:hypothetical protein
MCNATAKNKPNDGTTEASAPEGNRRAERTMHVEFCSAKEAFTGAIEERMESSGRKVGCSGGIVARDERAVKGGCEDCPKKVMSALTEGP